MITQEEAVKQALMLALTATTEDQHNRAVALAEQLSAGISEDTVLQWMNEISAQLR